MSQSPSLAVTPEAVLELVHEHAEGLTQMEVFESFADDFAHDPEAIGIIMQATSRVLSDLAKNGTLDDSGRVGKKHVYKVPAKALPSRATKLEALREENEKLKGQLKAMESARDFVFRKLERLQEIRDMEAGQHQILVDSYLAQIEALRGEVDAQKAGPKFNKPQAVFPQDREDGAQQ